ncbi:MAG: alpha/beta hydrolase [Anaerolineales bacterium]|nr:alpha/beta hydrolase [Anaerolineales bacterium]
MADWAQDTLVVNGARLNYYRTGGDGPPLVLVHGFTDNGLCWTRVAQALESSHDIIMPDLRGHGCSERVSPGSFVDLALDLSGLIAELGLEQPALLGHSLGAGAAARLAALEPECVGSLVLEDPPWHEILPPGEDQRRAAARQSYFQEWAQRLAQLQSLPREEAAAQARAENPNWDETEIQAWVDAKQQLDLAVFEADLRSGGPWWELTLRIACPTLLVTGDPALGAIVTPEVAQEVTRRISHLEVAHIADAGHSIHRDQYALFIEAVTGFLQANAEGKTIC